MRSSSTTQGAGIVVGHSLTGAGATLARRAVTAKDVVTAVESTPIKGVSSLMVALSPHDGLVVFEASPIVPNRPTPPPRARPTKS